MKKSIVLLTLAGAILIEGMLIDRGGIGDNTILKVVDMNKNNTHNYIDCNVMWNRENDVLHADAFSTDSSKYEQAPYGLDENGICYYDYGTNYNHLGKYKNPTFVVAYADALYSEYLKGEEKKELFLAQVDYLIDSATVEGDYAYWPYPFELSAFNCPNGWYSAMTSGRVLGLLARTHSLTDDEHYLEFAQKVFNKLCLAREKGGMTTYMNDNEAWLEEDVYHEADSFKVLNGHIYGLSGLYDYALYTENESAQNLVQKCFNALLHHIDEYDSGFLSYYCEYMPSKEKSFAAPRDYHTIHILQLLWCYKVTNEVTFLDKAMRFQMYDCFNPMINANHTVDEVEHGVDKMNLTFGNNYWSASEFPVELMIDCGNTIYIEEIVLLGHSVITAPTSVDIDYSIDGINWYKLNGKMIQDGQYVIDFLAETIALRFCKINIGGCTEGDLLALDGIGLIQADNQCFPIFYDSEMFNGGEIPNYNVSMNKILDDDDSYIKIEGKHCNLFVPNINGIVELKLEYEEINVNEDLIKCFGSDDLITWREVPFEYSTEHLRINSNSKYIRIEFVISSSLKIYELEW